MSLVTQVEVTLSPDGTYLVQQVAYTDEGRRVDLTVSGAGSIPSGLRGLADMMEQRALAEFIRKPRELDHVTGSTPLEVIHPFETDPADPLRVRDDGDGWQIEGGILDIESFPPGSVITVLPAEVMKTMEAQTRWSPSGHPVSIDEHGVVRVWPPDQRE